MSCAGSLTDLNYICVQISVNPRSVYGICLIFSASVPSTIIMTIFLVPNPGNTEISMKFRFYLHAPIFWVVSNKNEVIRDIHARINVCLTYQKPVNLFYIY